jgi:hypothetical protein
MKRPSLNLKAGASPASLVQPGTVGNITVKMLRTSLQTRAVKQSFSVVLYITNAVSGSTEFRPEGIIPPAGWTMSSITARQLRFIYQGSSEDRTVDFLPQLGFPAPVYVGLDESRVTLDYVVNADNDIPETSYDDNSNRLTIYVVRPCGA